MIKYILKKIGYMIVTLWVILTITFFLMNCIPGDPTGQHESSSGGRSQQPEGTLGPDKPVGRAVYYLSEESSSRPDGRVYKTPGLKPDYFERSRLLCSWVCRPWRV